MGRTTAQQAEWAESHLLFNIMEVYFCHGIKKVIVTFFSPFRVILSEFWLFSSFSETNRNYETLTQNCEFITCNSERKKSVFQDVNL